MDNLDLELIEKSKLNSPWDLGNKILYDLCDNHFGHDTVDKIVGKVWLIGRAYSVAVERRKNKKEKNEINDNFYIDTVAPTLKESKLDERLKELKKIDKLTSDKIGLILETHNHLTETLKKITNLDKRSFSSKYLHFHLPKLFFIYDSRAVIALGKLRGKTQKKFKSFPHTDNVDKAYATFFHKCYDLTEQIKERYQHELTPRQLDNLLLEIANKELRIKAAANTVFK